MIILQTALDISLRNRLCVLKLVLSEPFPKQSITKRFVFLAMHLTNVVPLISILALINSHLIRRDVVEIALLWNLLDLLSMVKVTLNVLSVLLTRKF